MAFGFVCHTIDLLWVFLDGWHLDWTIRKFFPEFFRGKRQLVRHSNCLWTVCILVWSVFIVQRFAEEMVAASAESSQMRCRIAVEMSIWR